MSVRDQRVGTSHPDKVKEDVSLEYITMSRFLSIKDVPKHSHITFLPQSYGDYPNRAVMN